MTNLIWSDLEMESSSSSMFMELEDFGQKVDLTRQIREVLLNYPEGTMVLKELIQNCIFNQMNTCSSKKRETKLIENLFFSFLKNKKVKILLLFY